MKEQPPLKQWKVSEYRFKGYYLWFEEIGLVKVEVVHGFPPPNFNPPLTYPDAHLLVQVREIFGDLFSLFRNPPTISRPSFLSRVYDPSITYSSGLGASL
jgi:hypothetical protein